MPRKITKPSQEKASGQSQLEMKILLARLKELEERTELAKLARERKEKEGQKSTFLKVLENPKLWLGIITAILPLALPSHGTTSQQSTQENSKARHEEPQDKGCKSLGWCTPGKILPPSELPNYDLMFSKAGVTTVSHTTLGQAGLQYGNILRTRVLLEQEAKTPGTLTPAQIDEVLNLSKALRESI